MTDAAVDCVILKLVKILIDEDEQALPKHKQPIFYCPLGYLSSKMGLVRCYKRLSMLGVLVAHKIAS